MKNGNLPQQYYLYIFSNLLYNNKCNQKLPHIYVMTNWMASNYFLSLNLYIWLSLSRSHSQSANVLASGYTFCYQALCPNQYIFKIYPPANSGDTFHKCLSFI